MNKMSKEERRSVKCALRKKQALNQMIGRSEAITQIKKKIENISSCDVSVLITGESGTGKELVARAIHYLGVRARNPFIPVNCCAIPENLFENELFGHCKGAFTDAYFHQEGLIKETEGGTLFLDEIGAITPYIQVKLLRILQDKVYKPLGSSQFQKANIRILAATNIDLRSMVEKHNFREDLFYRLNIIMLTIPPLRERKEDIPLLVEHFLKKYSREYKKPVKVISDDAMDKFISYSWPGNIRELENKIQNIIVTADCHTITREKLNLFVDRLFTKYSCKEKFSEAKQEIIQSFERQYLTNLLELCKGDVVRAARKAGKSRTALWNLILKHKISPKKFKQIS